MLHVCYDKDFVNMQISFLGLIQKFSKNHLKKAVVLHLITRHIYTKKLFKYLSKQYQLSFIFLQRNVLSIQMFCTC